MLQKPDACEGCTLYTKGTGFVPPDGTGRNSILLLGEAAGAREGQTGKPFVGDAGYQLNRTLEYARFTRDDFRIDNVVKCQPPKNWLEGAPWEYEAVVRCDSYLRDTIARMKPKVIVPMGNIALRSTTGQRGIGRARGYVYDFQLDGHRCYVVPTYHPSFVMRGKQNLTVVQAWDLRRAFKVANEGFTEQVSHYIEHPSLDDEQNFYLKAREAALAGKWLAADIETPSTGGLEEDEYGEITDAEIIRASFSFESRTAITFSWALKREEWVRAIFNLPWERIVFWNADFDVPRLRARGAYPSERLACVLDAMWMWHFLQSDLPRGLGYVSTFYTQLKEWKSLNHSRPEFYSCVDADATIQNVGAITERLKREGRLEQFIRHSVELEPVLKHLGNSGVLIDLKHQAEFREKIDGELKRENEEIQKAIPRELFGFERRRHVPVEVLPGSVYQTKSKQGTWDFDSETGEWGVRYPFLYNSPKQVIKYLKHKGYAVTQNYKTGKDTTDADALDKLTRDHPDDPLFPLILHSREFRKIIGQYIDGYVPGADGRIRTHFDRSPASWRFASKDPNVQNVLRRSELASAYRKQFIAAPGHVLVEADWRAIEAVFTGWYAKDPEYIRAAKLGVHTILLSHKVGEPVSLSWSDADIKGALKVLKKRFPDLYEACKRCVHLSAYGGSPRRMRISHPEYFATVRDAEELQAVYFGTIAKKVKQWHQDTLRKAHEPPHYLENVFGYRRYFWDIFKWEGRKQKWGTQAKEALSHLPQSTAAGVMSEALLYFRLVESVYRAIKWSIHDSLLLEVPEGDSLAETITLVQSGMERPIVKMDGLVVEAEVKYGRNWAPFDEKLNPNGMREWEG